MPQLLARSGPLFESVDPGISIDASWVLGDEAPTLLVVGPPLR